MEQRLLFLKGKQKAMIKEFLDQNNLLLEQAARLLGVSESALKHWIKEEYTLPLKTYNLICENTKGLTAYRSYIKGELPPNWGQVKGGKSRVSNISDLVKYLASVRAVKDKKRLEYSELHTQHGKCRCRLLNALVKENVNLIFVLATCLLTDGSLGVTGNNYRICYYTKDKVLKEFMTALLFKLSKFAPKTFLGRDGVYRIRVSDFFLAKELLKLSPSYKKNPANRQPAESYLREIQPSITFLNKASCKTREWCLRFALSTDGCITVSKSGTGELNFACYNPQLAPQWLEFFKSHGINGHLGGGKESWSQIKGVRIYDLESIKNFITLGGFVPGVRISGKSKRYKGLEKNTLLNRYFGARSLLAT